MKRKYSGNLPAGRSGTKILLTKKINSMRSVLYWVAVILVIGWLIGIFAYSARGLIHALLVLAIIALLLGIIKKSSDL
jgi:hypothetical protein